MAELYELSAREAVAGVANGDLTVEAITRSYLDRAAAIEGDVGAWHHLDPDAAIATAQAVDAGPAGPMKGALIGVKDVICTADMPTTFGSKAYEGFRPPYDAACVTMAKAAGAMVLGKTVSTEFAAMSPGKTRNPFNPDHTPGGSSSGSAAAVGAKLVPIALGTQTAGSTIRPAAFCNAVGYKPSYDLIDTTGTKTLAACFDTIGVIARDVRDAAFYTAHVTGKPELEPDAAPPAPKVALYRTECWHLALPEAQEALDRAIAALAAKGVGVTEIPLMPGFDNLLDIHERMMDWGMTTGLSYERLFIPDRISPVSREMLETRAANASAAKFAEAEAEAIAARANIGALFGDYDVILTPPATGEAPKGLERTGDASFNRGWTMLHLPCITVPAGTGPTGLPVGVQLVARKEDDARLLSAAAFLEAALAE